jgi:hypothetical protein
MDLILISVVLQLHHNSFPTLNELVSEMFPDLAHKHHQHGESEEFQSWLYWKSPLPVHEILQQAEQRTMTKK